MGDILARAPDAARFLGVSTRTSERWSTEGTNGLPERDITGARDRQLRARAKADKDAAALTADELAVKLGAARSDGHKIGFSDGVQHL